MRRTVSACRSGLSVAAAVVLLSACGGSDEGDSDSASPSPSPSETASATSESTAAAADSEFCTEAASIEERVGSTLGDRSDPAALPEALQQAASEIRNIEPPAEIAADWNALADGVEQIGAAFASIDPDDPNALASFQQQVGQLQSQLSSASTNVQNYLSEECGLESGSSESAAPTS